ncbi:BA14K family protein [Bartonella alsatica]|uniref:Lectin-like protein BA14k n=2 Tax=Bartonella alsatica TaxID=52764 RepID=J0YJB5_9HYPH|nr:BA14K family protein [Bartonella alsatica]EJF74618.1 hypothetical protein MEC_01142 [Bartonella alsatica IBS 382]QLC52577.1 BA14K family protein [Bartonella alsatica]
MPMLKSLYYALVIAFIGSVFIIVSNFTGSAQKSNTEVRIFHQSSVPENWVPLVVTGRKELNGFKGYRHYRRGYRKYSDNWWYPEVAFLAVSGLDAKHIPLKAVSASLEKKEPWMFKQHIDSCHARYRSYNEHDNSYQPFHGSRRQCFSQFFKG